MTQPNSHDLLIKATDLAGGGEYADAIQLLAQLGGRDSTDPEVLDLLARIHAQRGELLDADECWALMQHIDPDLPSARAGRRRIAALQVRRYSPGVGRTGVVVLVAGVVVAAVLVGAAGVVLSRQAPTPDPSIAAAVKGDGTAQRQLSQRVDGLSSQLKQSMTHTAQVVDALRSAFGASPNLTVQVQSGTVLVTFDTGLFSSGVVVSEQGKAALADFANRLGNLASQVSITLDGHTDNAQQPTHSRYPDNVQLGLARAATAAQALSSVSGLPLSDFALTSDGATNPPFPDTTAEGQARNRTITIVLRPND